MHLTGVDFFFWVAGFTGAVLLFIVLWVKARAASFPFFTGLITVMIVRTVTLFLITRYGNKHQYFLGYFTFGALDLAFQLAVIYELATHVFRPMGRWARDTLGGFIVLVCGSVSVAFLLTWLTTPPANTFLRTLLIRGNFLSSVLNTELFVGMSLLAATARLPWKTHAARIAQALGAYSLIGIVTEAGHSILGMDHRVFGSSALSLVRFSSYLTCQTYWIVMLWREAPAPRPLPEKVRLQLFSLQRRVEYDLDRLRSWK